MNALVLPRPSSSKSKLNQILGDKALRTHLFALRRLVQVMRGCKLYDYERHCWTDFSGRVTSFTAAARLRPEQGAQGTAPAGEGDRDLTRPEATPA